MTFAEYVAVILPIIKAVRTQKKSDPKKYKGSHLWYLYRQAFYGFDDFVDRTSHCKVSRRAQMEYAKLGHSRSLSSRTWREQGQFDCGRQKGKFHYEHVYTGDMFRKDVDSLSDEQLTADGIAKLVLERYFVAWILKVENQALDSRGYKSFRPGNPFEAYQKVGIELADLGSKPTAGPRVPI